MFKRIFLVIELIDCASDMRLLNFKLNCIEKNLLLPRTLKKNSYRDLYKKNIHKIDYRTAVVAFQLKNFRKIQCKN